MSKLLVKIAGLCRKYRELIAYRDKPAEEKKILQNSVRESVKQAGSENLANYLLTVYRQAYQNIDEPSSEK